MNKENYLPEDYDLIDRLNKIGPMSTGLAADRQKQKMNSIQIEAILRSRKKMEEFDKSTTWFSKILGGLVLIQITIAVIQFGFEFLTTNHFIVGIVLLMLLICLIVYVGMNINNIFKVQS